MIKTTQKELKRMVVCGEAQDVTYYNMKEADELRNKEGYLTQIAYAQGIYGCNGMLLKGNNTNTLYAIKTRSQAIYLF